MLNKAYIDLNVLRGNAKRVKEKLPENVRFCAVVKADAYGHGACAVANAIYDTVDCFAVALVEEAIALRRCGIDKDILVLIPPFDEDLETAVYYSLTLTVVGTEGLKAIDREARRQNATVKVHIKYNTGMNRFGVDGLDELKKVLEFSEKCERIIVDGAFSHFANPENKKSRISAQNKFLLANNLVKSYNKKAICHISASGGFLSGVFFDMVRIGILLYGYKPFDSRAVDVFPVMKILSPVVGHRDLSAGERALYGETRAEKDSSLNLVRCGYADGFKRDDSGIFSKRCMDVSMYFGSAGEREIAVMENADEIAKKTDTISYEVLTKCAMRAEKIYLN